MAEILHNDWAEYLNEEFQKEYYIKLRKFLAEEYRTKTVYPDMYDIFNALHYTPYKDVKVVILTSDKSNILKLDVQKFNKEYPILEVAKTDKFHDRFIVIDNKELYHVGASLKDLGKKCFAISKLRKISKNT